MKWLGWGKPEGSGVWKCLLEEGGQTEPQQPNLLKTLGLGREVRS